jgi:hypothetical protein
VRIKLLYHAIISSYFGRELNLPVIVHTTPGVRRCLLFYGEGRDRVLTHHADLDQTEARLHLEDMLAQTAHLSKWPSSLEIASILLLLTYFTKIVLSFLVEGLNESCASISVDLIDPSCRIFICRLFGSSILLSVIDLESSDKVTALREIKASSKILDQGNSQIKLCVVSISDYTF